MDLLTYIFIFIYCIVASASASASGPVPEEEMGCKWVVGRGTGSKREQISNMDNNMCRSECYRRRKARKDLTLNGVTVEKDKIACWCEFNMEGSDDDSDYKSCKMVFSTFELIGEGLKCTRESVYTIKAGVCDGWGRTSLDNCKGKCNLNEAPAGCDDDPSRECKYVQWRSNGWCHLADSKCKLITASSDLKLYERRGSALIPGSEGCWEKCKNKGGSCESICGLDGFCCRQGVNDCPEDIAVLNTNLRKHACVRAPFAVKEEMVKCKWVPGRGKGENSKREQQTNMDNKACIDHCYNLRVNTKDTTLNGVTVGFLTTTCWCEYNMEKGDHHSEFMSCKMEFSGVGGMHCNEEKINQIEDTISDAIVKSYEEVSDDSKKWSNLHGTITAQKTLLEKCLIHGYTSEMYCSLSKASAKYCKLSNSFKSVMYMLQNLPERRPILTDIDHNGALKSEAFKSFQSRLTLSLEEVKQVVRDVNKDFRRDYGNYLSQIAEYDNQIASQDKIYIFNILHTYQVKIDNLGRTIEKMLTDVIYIMIGKSAADTISSAARLGATIAKSFNPLGWIFGATEPGDIEEATALLANSANSAIKTAHLFAMLGSIAKSAKEIHEGLNSNAKLHDDFFKLIAVNTNKEGGDIEKLALTFTDSYGEFSPAPGLKKEDLLKFTSTLGAMFEAACGEIGDSKSTAGNVVAMGAFIAGYCTGVTIGPLIDELDGVFEESFDAQFEIMDIGAALARSVIAKELARRVKVEMDKGRISMLDYAMGVLSSATYRRDVIYAACDAFEYNNFGIVNELCIKLKAEPMHSEITLLSDRVANLHQLNCDTHHRHILIPASSGPVEKGHINLDELYNGKVEFHIPDVEYAKKHNWIVKGDPGNSIYVKEFSLFMPPSAAKTERQDEVSIIYGGPNQLNGRTFYLPPNEMGTAYTYNPMQMCHPIEVEPYSYPYCPSLFRSKTCVVRYGDTDASYLPSLYGQWYIHLMNNQNHTLEIPLERLSMPQVKGKIYLQALVKTCSNAVRSGHGYIPLIVNKRAATEGRRQCCGTLKKVVNFEGGSEGQCKDCPDNSEPHLEGYYCKDVNAED